MKVRVTDHAVLRYLERVHGIDVPAARARIGIICSPAVAQGAVAIQSDGHFFIVKQDAVVTVLERGARPQQHNKIMEARRPRRPEPRFREILEDAEE